MTNSNPNENTHPLRSILKRMERSIDDARHRRTRTPENPVHTSSVQPGTANSTMSGEIATNSLDTPIVSTKSTNSITTETGPMRDERTMFDFDGPRMKARPKRHSVS